MRLGHSDIGTSRPIRLVDIIHLIGLFRVSVRTASSVTLETGFLGDRFWFQSSSFP